MTEAELYAMLVSKSKEFGCSLSWMARRLSDYLINSYPGTTLDHILEFVDIDYEIWNWYYKEMDF